VAIYYMNVKVIGRSAGRTATGAAAYRAGERIVDERTGQVFDYTRRRGEIETEILAPHGAPDWVQERSRLWNEVERAERRGDAQVAREIVVAFPNELGAEQQRELVRNYVREEFVSKGMVADVAIHRNPNNPHAHIMLTMREIGPEGFSAKKNREWNRPEALERWRESWAEHTNRELARDGREERIDHRSLAEQGLERAPQVHLGPHASALERRGISTEKGDHNRLVAEHNAVVIDLEKARNERQALAMEKAADERYARRMGAGWTSDDAKLLAYLESEHAGGAELTQQGVRNLCEEQQEVLNGVQRRIDQAAVLDNTIREAERELHLHRAAQSELRNHETPLASVKRWFSQSAKEAYQEAQWKVKSSERTLQHLGVHSDADLDQRRGQLASLRAELPELRQRAETIKGTLGILEKGLKGFERAADRQRQAREREQLERDRAMMREYERRFERDRGRDSGRGR
jgi:ATP-dependent exoDNAse (exonuclease V) alpha subunit